MSVGLDADGSNNPGTGVYNISGGTLAVANDLNIGDTATGIGTMTVSGATQKIQTTHNDRTVAKPKISSSTDSAKNGSNPKATADQRTRPLGEAGPGL